MSKTYRKDYRSGKNRNRNRNGKPNNSNQSGQNRSNRNHNSKKDKLNSIEMEYNQLLNSDRMDEVCFVSDELPDVAFYPSWIDIDLGEAEEDFSDDVVSASNNKDDEANDTVVASSTNRVDNNNDSDVKESSEVNAPADDKHSDSASEPVDRSANAHEVTDAVDLPKTDKSDNDSANSTMASEPGSTDTFKNLEVDSAEESFESDLIKEIIDAAAKDVEAKGFKEGNDISNSNVSGKETDTDNENSAQRPIVFNIFIVAPNVNEDKTELEPLTVETEDDNLSISVDLKELFDENNQCNVTISVCDGEFSVEIDSIEDIDLNDDDEEGVQENDDLEDSDNGDSDEESSDQFNDAVTTFIQNLVKEFQRMTNVFDGCLELEEFFKSFSLTNAFYDYLSQSDSSSEIEDEDSVHVDWDEDEVDFDFKDEDFDLDEDYLDFDEESLEPLDDAVTTFIRNLNKEFQRMTNVFNGCVELEEFFKSFSLTKAFFDYLSESGSPSEIDINISVHVDWDEDDDDFDFDDDDDFDDDLDDFDFGEDDDLDVDLDKEDEVLKRAVKVDWFDEDPRSLIFSCKHPVFGEIDIFEGEDEILYDVVTALKAIGASKEAIKNLPLRDDMPSVKVIINDDRGKETVRKTQFWPEGVILQTALEDCNRPRTDMASFMLKVLFPLMTDILGICPDFLDKDSKNPSFYRQLEQYLWKTYIHLPSLVFDSKHQVSDFYWSK